MDSPLTQDFTWVVRKCKWVNGFTDEPPGDSRFLMPVEPGGRVTVPLRDATGLFRTFAATPATEEGIAEFANRHGMLGGEADIFVGTEDAGVYGLRGESFIRWQAEIKLMKAAIDLWDGRRDSHVVNAATFQLDRLVDDLWWLDKGSPRPDRPEVTRTESELGERAILNGTWRERGLFTLKSVMNRCLQRSLSPVVDMTPGRASLRLAHQPDCLRTVMWLQFVHAVSREAGYRQCGCGQFFEVSTGPEGHRTNRRYCSGACKSRAYRQAHPDRGKRKGSGSNAVQAR